MSNTGLIIEERSRDIGDFLVGRLIPFRKKRMVGPFIFIDHMGPEALGPEKYMDVDQHPHIGLSTLTYLMEGELQHLDGIGTNQTILPGSVNWMVAGKGVTHTERTPQHLRASNTEFTMHGYQIWVALPKELEDIEPEFYHIEADALPAWQDRGADFKLVAGKGYGKESPVPVHSELFMIDIKTTTDYQFKAAGNLSGEIGITIVTGSVTACGDVIEAGNMLVSKTEDVCDITIKAGSHILIFGGEPFPEERHIYWNFVSHSKDKIEAAKEAWKDKTFPMMENDDTYVALPE
ncbi:pirin family protein [Nonlabens marinus]|uniref:Pirin domain protein n=1 Tax=Nonlabens marinus S1-08 TaxID=1454201 RepID=W8VZQ2_9FLAO|nr:pirin family protein [Nonlabens marinus]BAO54971.1 pirin domain protein [Nonlabens marinus S1-08]